MGSRNGRYAALAVTLALAGCNTLANAPTVPQDETEMAASPSNVASLTQVIQQNPSDPQTYNVRGTVLGRANRNQEAISDFNKAISLDPNYTQAYANRGVVHRQMKRLDLALSDFNKALEIDPTYVPAWTGRGIVYRQQGQARPAFEDFNKAIALKPDEAPAYHNRGLLYQSQKQHQYAIDDFTTALNLSRKAEPLVARSLSYIANNDFKSAASDLDDAVQMEPENLQAWTARGLAYEKLGNKDRAAGSYARALQLKQNYEPAKTGFARVGGRMGQNYETF
jgi:Tfp pilus assembly protein PilF